MTTLHHPVSRAVPSVHALTAADRTRAAAIVTTAFAADPVGRWVYPDAETFLNYFPAFVEAFAGRAFDAGSAFATDDMLGTALWLPPGVHPDGDRMGEILKASLTPEQQGEVFEFAQLQTANHPEFPHWYLPLLAVDPARQGRGAGSALLGHSLALCDRLGMPAYLEATTLRNRALYERHGFEVVNEIQYGTSPTMWGMLRSPR